MIYIDEIGTTHIPEETIGSREAGIHRRNMRLCRVALRIMNYEKTRHYGGDW